MTDRTLTAAAGETKQGNLLETDHCIRFSETALNKKLKISALFNLLQDAAAQHISFQGYGLERLHKRKQAWVLLKMCLEIKEYPRFGEVVTIATWQPGIEKFYALRDYTISDYTGVDKIVGTSYWIALDTERMRMVRPENYLAEKNFIPDRRALLSNPERLKPIRKGSYSIEHQVRYNEIDMNGHLNNARYLELCLRSLPAVIGLEFELKGIEICYAYQTGVGDSLKVITNEERETDGGRGGRVFRHSVFLDGREDPVCNARTVWQGVIPESLLSGG